MAPEFEILVSESASGVQLSNGAKITLDGHVLRGVRDFSVRYEINSPALVTVTFLARRVRISSGGEK